MAVPVGVTPARDPTSGPTIRAGILLGLGLGGFLDGILLHQVLRWHHMLTSHPDPAVARDVGLNLMWDGFFHLATYALTLAGVALLWRAWRRPGAARSGRVFAGSLLLGAGLFNLVEGLVDHHLLGIHHVHPSGALAWDLGYLALGALLALGGWLLVRSAPELAARRAGARGRLGRGA